MLAGNVTVTLVNGDLIIQGDHLDNSVQIEQVSPNAFKVSGRKAYYYDYVNSPNDRTLINGKPLALTVPGVVDDIQITMNGGADGVYLSGLNRPMVLPDDLRISTGTGNDSVQIMGVRNRDTDDVMTIDLGAGNDGLSLEGVTCRAALNVIGGDGNDRATLRRVNDTSPSLLGSRNSVTISLGAGNDTLRVSTLYAASITLEGGVGSDSYDTDMGRPSSRYRYAGFERVASTRDRFS